MQLVKGIELAAYQIKELAADVGSHDHRFGEIEAQLNEIKTNLALLTASKTRSDLTIAALPDYMKKVDAMYDSFVRMNQKMDGIISQAWGGFLSAIALSIVAIVISQMKPSKANESDYHLVARHEDRPASPTQSQLAPR